MKNKIDRKIHSLRAEINELKERRKEVKPLPCCYESLEKDIHNKQLVISRFQTLKKKEKLDVKYGSKRDILEED
jgi:hypothetical protein